MDSIFYGNRQPASAPKPATGEKMSVSGVYPRNSFQAPRQSNLFVPPAIPRPPSFIAPAPAPAPASQPLRQSLRLSQSQPEEPTCCSKYCAWTTLKYYKPYFNVTSSQVLQRMLHSLKCWSNTFFLDNQPADLYGPFWIYTTLAFILSAVSNILKFQVSKTIAYDFEVVGTALGMVYMLGFIFPLILALIIRCHTTHTNATYTSIICLYGYSQTIFLICLVLCSLNVSILHWVLIGFATFSRTWWILMNIGSLDLPAGKRVVIVGFVLGEAVLYFLVVKFYFVKSLVVRVEERVSHYRIRHYGGLFGGFGVME